MLLLLLIVLALILFIFESFFRKWAGLGIQAIEKQCEIFKKKCGRLRHKGMWIFGILVLLRVFYDVVGLAFIYHYFVLGYGLAETVQSIVGYASEAFFMCISNGWQQVVDVYVAGRGWLVKTFRSFGVWRAAKAFSIVYYCGVRLVIFLPLLLFIFFFVFAPRVVDRTAYRVLALAQYVWMFCALILFYYVVLCGEIFRVNFGVWFSCGEVSVCWGFLFDGVSVMMLFVVAVISMVVQFYSVMYMVEDASSSRFLSYISLFTFFMLVLVLADNLLVLFVGWEGVGLCSYLLISFWNTRVAANKAALKALIVNRVADIGLLLGILLALSTFGSVDYEVLYNVVPTFVGSSISFLGWTVDVLTTFCVLLLIGAAGKSAQLGFHMWLPDAMEGPTPVSALIHAATMVTAGVFLLIRCSSFFVYAPGVLNFVMFLGALTAFFGASVATVQTDIKKVIAYSTCSQLGLMFMACGAWNSVIGLFHLVNHAFFKALLFLCAGLIIRGLSGEQDIRSMGGLIRKSPEIFSWMLVASLSLMGVPFLSGFFSKELVLNVVLLSGGAVGKFSYLCGLLTTVLTAVYSVRLLFFVFFCKPRNSRKKLANFVSTPVYLRKYMYLLACGSVFSGYIGNDIFVGAGRHIFQNNVFGVYGGVSVFSAECLPWYIKILPLVCSIVGGLFGVVFYFGGYYRRVKFKAMAVQVYRFLGRAWSINMLLNRYVVKNWIVSGFVNIFLVIDKYVLEHFGPRGLTKLIRRISKLYFDAGSFVYVFRYSFLILFCLLIVVAVCVLI